MGLRVTLSVLAVPIAAGLGLLIYADRSTTFKIGLVVMLCSMPFAVSSEVSGGVLQRQTSQHDSRRHGESFSRSCSSDW